MAKQRALPMTKPDKIDLDQGALDRLSSVFRREIESGRLPGAVMLIARGGEIGYFEALGARDPATGADMDKDSIFRIYSMTKPIVSTAVMQLVEEGRIQLADPLSAYIPAFADTKVGVARDGGMDLVAPNRPITIQDLLRHTSGLTYEFLGEHPVQKAYIDANIASANQTNAEHVAALAKLPLFNHPGVAWDYSRSTDVLGRLVEFVGGRTLGEELRARILDPLGMDDTAFAVAEQDHDRIAEPFAIDPDAKTPVRLLDIRRPAKFESGGGGLVSTAHDYARFSQMLLNKGTLAGATIVKPESIALMAQNQIGDLGIYSDGTAANPGRPGQKFGLDFAVYTDPEAGQNPFGKGTFYWSGAAGTIFWIDPVNDTFFVGLVQSMGGNRPGAMNFRNDSGKLILDAMKPTAAAATPAEATKQAEPAH